MKTALLRLAKRSPDGVRRWIVPGAPNAVILLPASRSFFKAAEVRWPHMRSWGEWEVRGVRLDWHRDLAKRELIKLIDSVQPVATKDTK